MYSELLEERQWGCGSACTDVCALCYISSLAYSYTCFYPQIHVFISRFCISHVYVLNVRVRTCIIMMDIPHSTVHMYIIDGSVSSLLGYSEWSS